MERVLLGSVAVDSGQIMIGDPCYRAEYEKIDAEAKPMRVRLWGRDAEAVAETLRGKGLEVEKNKHTFYVTGKGLDAQGYATLIEETENAIQTAGHLAFVYLDTTSTRDLVFNATSSANLGGEVRSPSWPPGAGALAVAFAPGLGDGVYDVYACYKDLPDWGRRIVRVEIDCLC